MTNEEIYNEFIYNQKVDDELDKLRTRLVMKLRGKNDDVIEDVVKFTKGIERILSWYQMEMYHLAFDLMESNRMIHNTVKVMELYGVDSSIALSGWRCDEHLQQEFDFARQSGIYRVPEKLRSHLK